MVENPFELENWSWFWFMVMGEWAEHEKARLLYELDWESWASDEEQEAMDDTEYCDYTGDECFGDKMFCEECPVLTETETW